MFLQVMCDLGLQGLKSQLAPSLIVAAKAATYKPQPSDQQGRDLQVGYRPPPTNLILSAFGWRRIPSFAIFAAQKIIGLRHVGDSHICAVVVNFFAGPQRDHAQQHDLR